MSPASSSAQGSGPLPEPKLLFLDFATRAGTLGGARERFQLLITDLVRVEHPTADTVVGPGGQDWGIDTFVGRFDDAMGVWQSKFFLEGVGDTQRQEIRNSFNQVLKKAKENGITLDAWCLCIPCDMSPDERKWFDTWAAKQSRTHDIEISLWAGTALRYKLMRADAYDIRVEYFGTAADELKAEKIATSGDLTAFDDALFVHQLHEAGQVETDAARGLFFAADALFRDLAARGDENATEAMNELHLEIETLWELRFNGAVATADEQGRIAGLIDQVVHDAGSVQDPDGIRLRPAHRRGIVHRLVEGAQAGWVAHWRDVAVQHRAARATTTDLARAGTANS